MSDVGAPSWLDDQTQQRSWRALLVGMTLLFDRLDDDLRATFGISLTEYEILVRLSEREDRRMRMAQLADAMSPTAAAGSPTPSRRLERAGLVDRGSRPEDGRGIVAQLTDQGYDLLVRMAPDPRHRRPRPHGRPGQPPTTSPRSAG